MNPQIVLFLLLGLLSACATPERPAPSSLPRKVDSSRNPAWLSPDLYTGGAQPSREPVVRYGRYTLVSTAPSAEQRDLLAQIIDIGIPQGMKPSVHDAMEYVLQRSGYSLCPRTAGSVNVLYTRPLPAAHYQLGPMTLRNTLQVLAGPAWQVRVDEVRRSVCFESRPGYQHPSVAEGVSPATATEPFATLPKTHSRERRP